jgi:hypothetical protein
LRKIGGHRCLRNARFKFAWPLPIGSNMGVSGISGESSSYQYQSPTVVEAERTMLVMKKQQDAVKDQGQSLVELVKKSADGVGGRINVYA